MNNKTLQAKELQNRVYRYICEYYRARGVSPTYAEMLEYCKIASRGHLNHIIQNLIEAGKVELIDGKGRWRNLRPTNHAQYDRSRQGRLPYLGAIAANAQNPLELLDVLEDDIAVGENLLPTCADRSRCFVLDVQGDSMVEAHILDGDRVVLEQRDVYNPGEILALYLRQQNAVTLKRLQPGRDGTVTLEAESHKHPNRVENAENVLIMGRVVAVMRTMA